MRQSPIDLGNRLFNMLSRAVLRKIDDARLLQEQSIDMRGDEKRDHTERFQFPFLTSVPHEENKLGVAEGIVCCITGDRSHMIMLVVDDRRYRICNLANGELMIHDEQGQQVHITRAGVNTSVPHDLVVDVRIMKKDKGDPLNPTKYIQASKTDMKDDVMATVHFDRKSFTVTHRNKDKYKDEDEYKPQIKHEIMDKDDPKKIYSSMVMDMDGITWTTTGTLTWNAPHQKWNGDDMTWESKTELHDAINSIDTKAIRTTLTTKKPNSDESVSVVETVHPTDQGGVTLIGMEKSKDEADASKIVTDTGDAKHAKALPE